MASKKVKPIGDSVVDNLVATLLESEHSQVRKNSTSLELDSNQVVIKESHIGVVA